MRKLLATLLRRLAARPELAAAHPDRVPPDRRPEPAAAEGR